MQRTRPQTLASALNDSPVGLAAWIVEKFRAWSDCDGDVERRFTKDELLTNITIYWVTETIGSSFRLYHDAPQIPMDQHARRVEVPCGVAVFPRTSPSHRDPGRSAPPTSCTGPRCPAAATSRRSRSRSCYADDLRAFFRAHRGGWAPGVRGSRSP